ncbi:MAG: tetratricopeptide repeat protein [Fimbriimonadaceae bacterium]|nr:tetratricopeptide repeat protein [Chitinophagales bacterium]
MNFKNILPFTVFFHLQDRIVPAKLLYIQNFFIIVILLLASCKTQQQTQTNHGFQLPDEIVVDEISSGTRGGTEDTLYIERTFIDACKLKALNDYEGAIVLLKEILRVDENNAPALYELSKIYFEYGRTEDAAELSKAAIKNDGNNEYYQLLLADILTYNKNFPEAAKILESLRTNYPKKTDNYYQLAYVYERMNEVDKSISVLTDAKKQFGEEESILFELQRLYIRSGDAENAIENLQKLITQNPGNPAYKSMIADVYELVRNTPLAETTFNKLLALDPDNPDLLFRRAEMEKENKKYTSYYNEIKNIFANADINIDKKIFFLVPFVDSVGKKNFVQQDFILELSKILTDVHSEDAKAFAMRGDFLYYAGQYNDARKNYRQSIAIRSDVYDVWMKLFYIDADSKQPDSLFAITTESLELYPNQPMGYYFNGIALMDMEKYDDAILVLKRSIPLTASNPTLKADIYFRLGDIYNEMKNYAESDNAYETSLQINPKNPYALNNYAYHLSVRGDKLEEAAKMAMIANELVPNNASLLDTYGWILYKQQKFDEAKTWIEKALKNGGSDSEVIIEHYGDILFKLGDKDAALEQWKKAKQLGIGSEYLDKKIQDGKLHE